MQKSGVWTTLWPPLSLALCAAILEQEGFSVKITDYPASMLDCADLKRHLLDFRPDLIIMSTATPSIQYDLETLSLIRKTAPACRTAAIGVHVSVLPDETLSQCADLDYIIRGEPEYTAKELAISLREGKDGAGVPGLSYRQGDRIVHEPDRPWIEELDSLPFPAWHLVDTSRYVLPFSRRPFLSIFSARGCPFSCIFCADHTYYGKKLRKRSPARIVDEMAHDMATFGISDFLFWTESFTFSRELVMEMTGEIGRRKLNVRWYCNSRVDHVDRELLTAMKKSGCRMISFGIESFNPEVLKNIKKGTTPEQAEEAVRLSHQCGLEVIAHCIFGLPGETEESMRDTVRRICRLPVDYAQFYAAVPFPGTEFYRSVSDRIKDTDRQWKNFEQDKYILNTGELTSDVVNRARNEAYRAFFFRPGMVGKVVRKSLEEGGLSQLFRLWTDFSSWVKGRK